MFSGKVRKNWLFLLEIAMSIWNSHDTVLLIVWLQ